MKPKIKFSKEVRAKGGRSSGGTRYYGGKFRGEDKMVRLIQNAIDKKKEKEELHTDDLIEFLKSSVFITELKQSEIKPFKKVVFSEITASVNIIT
jgi:hypothetical protein